MRHLEVAPFLGFPANIYLLKVLALEALEKGVKYVQS